MVWEVLFVFFSLTVYAQNDLVAHPAGDDQAPKPAAENQPYGKYLDCINRIRSPFARALDIDEDGFTRGESKVGPAKSAAIFSAPGEGTSVKFYRIGPDSATSTLVPIFKPKDFGSFEYPIQFRAGAEEVYMHYYVNEKTKRGNASSAGWENTGETPYVKLGTSGKYISQSETVLALETETVERLKTIPDRLTSLRDRPDWRFPNMYSRALADAQSVLCICMKTEDAQIQAATQTVAKAIGVDGDVNKCGPDKPVAWLNWIFPHAHASEKTAIRPTSKVVRVDFEIKAIGLTKDVLKICSEQGEIRVQIANMHLIDRAKKCSLSAAEMAQLVASNKDWTARVEKDTVVLKRLQR